MRKPATAHSVRHAGRTRSGGSFDAKPPAVPLVYQISGETFQTELPHVPLEVIDSIREAFEKQAGVGELVPDDPEYARRWRLAEPSALERMRTLFGWSVVAEFQRQAALEEIVSTPLPLQHHEHHEREE